MRITTTIAQQFAQQLANNVLYNLLATSSDSFGFDYYRAVGSRKSASIRAFSNTWGFGIPLTFPQRPIIP
ncbi:hypothetical protein HBH90_045410 [Parastagonospora nodorum]|nr:hypothetical protein HBH90_045410 [Parastagonospora nodorum]KAH5025192.1 hypothetical protein HBI74_128420 [Parastagonospora nodorum]KAH5474201.1 hypothetical protein HBI28_116890 [Parastagonospora nodorum]KAH6241640.1 hypothetical protein HBI15_004610 [Parastagonospora nodorum]KAH6364089.1 hypothetical protein HBI36_050010 [Parastagonospora nodorum]